MPSFIISSATTYKICRKHFCLYNWYGHLTLFNNPQNDAYANIQHNQCWIWISSDNDCCWLNPWGMEFGKHPYHGNYNNDPWGLQVSINQRPKTMICPTYFCHVTWSFWLSLPIWYSFNYRLNWQNIAVKMQHYQNGDIIFQWHLIQKGS